MTGFRIGKQFQFDASHRLETLPADHKCSRLHGHTYRVEVVLASAEVDEHGFVADFGELAPVGQYIRDRFDHRHLNDVLDVSPTSENLARHFFDWCAANLNLPDHARVAVVRVSETPATWAEYSGGGS